MDLIKLENNIKNIKNKLKHLNESELESLDEVLKLIDILQSTNEMSASKCFESINFIKNKYTK